MWVHLFSIVGIRPFSFFFLFDFICRAVVNLPCGRMCFVFFSLHSTTKSLLIVTVGFVVCMTCGCLILPSFFIICAWAFDLWRLSGCFCIYRTSSCVHLCSFLFFFLSFYSSCLRVLVFDTRLLRFFWLLFCLICVGMFAAPLRVAQGGCAVLLCANIVGAFTF